MSTRPRDCSQIVLAVDAGQRSEAERRFRFDRESIRLLVLTPFERWLAGADAPIGLEFEPSDNSQHLLECPHLRHFAPVLLESIAEPFARLDEETLLILTLASLPDLRLVRQGDCVSVVFPIDGLHEFLMAHVSRIRSSECREEQLQRMLEVSSSLGLNAEDWLEPESS